MRRSTCSVLVALTVFVAEPAWAVREGMHNGKIVAEQFERKGQWKKAALWREAMAMTLEYVSRPLAEEMLKRARAADNFREIREIQDDLKQTEELIVASRKKAAENRARASKDEKGIELEKKRIERYLDTWLQHYPHAMTFTWGLERMRRRSDRLRRTAAVKEAMETERQHWEKCADWYEAICVDYYETRDRKKFAHFRNVVSLLRQKAEFYRKKETDPNLDIRGQLAKIDEKLKVQPSNPATISLDKAIEMVRNDKRLSNLPGARFSGWYQGAYWVVHVHRGGRDMGLVTVDDETGRVLDVELNR